MINFYFWFGKKMTILFLVFLMWPSLVKYRLSQKFSWDLISSDRHFKYNISISKPYDVNWTIDLPNEKLSFRFIYIIIIFVLNYEIFYCWHYHNSCLDYKKYEISLYNYNFFTKLWKFKILFCHFIILL